MGLLHSPKIVTDNIKICLDPANLRSYDPEGTDDIGVGVTFDAQKTFTTVGTHNFVVPVGITSVSAITIGGGGGGSYTQSNIYPGGGGAGGGLAWGTFDVTPGESLSVVVGGGGEHGEFGLYGAPAGHDGGNSQIRRGATVLLQGGGGGGGSDPSFALGQGGSGGTSTGTEREGGGEGGDGGTSGNYGAGGGGGGAGGYTGDGGNGGAYNYGQDAPAGGGGGGGGADTSGSNSSYGGGVGLFGQGDSGDGGAGGNYASSGQGGSGGTFGNYGGGGGGGHGGPTNQYGGWPAAEGVSGKQGAVRIVYCGVTPPASWGFAYLSNTQTPGCITYGDGKFVMLMSDSDLGNSVSGGVYSTDGFTWTNVTNSTSSPVHNGEWQDIVYGNGKFVAVGNDGSVMYSTDGLSWTAATAPQANDWRGVAYGDGKFVAVSKDGTNRVMYDSDGTGTWTAASATDNLYWNSITYGNGKFVAVAWSGTDLNDTTSVRVMYSTDGITWSNSGITGIDNSISMNDVHYADGKFVAIRTGSTLGNQSVIYSTDGISWSNTGVTGVSNSYWRDVAYGNDYWVAVADYGSGMSAAALDKIMYSKDALNWTVVEMPATNGTDDYYWSKMAYGNNIFVTGAYTSGGDANSTSKILLSRFRQYPFATGTGIGDEAYSNVAGNFTAYDLSKGETAILKTDTISFVKEGNLGTFLFNKEAGGDYIELSNTSSLNYPITTSVTLSVFVKFNTVGSWQALFTKNRSTNTYLGIWLTNTNVASFYANSSGLGGATTLTTDTWYNIVAVQEADTSRKIYVNGVLDGTKTSQYGTTPSGSENWILGSATSTSGGYTNHFDGKMSHVCLYDRALTAAEVFQNYNTLKGRYN